MATRDENLLFGVFAAQLGQISTTLLSQIARVWAQDPAVDLSERLVAAGTISQKERSIIINLVTSSIKDHGGDAARTLRTFGGEEQVYESFNDSITLTDSGRVTTRGWKTDGDANVPRDTTPGVTETPGRYTQEREHARGGMGRILLVHDEHLKRDVALKELLPDIVGEMLGESDTSNPFRTEASTSGPMLGHFLQEAIITGQMEHPSIVPVYELGHRPDGTLYYTMKLVRGQSLASAIREADTLQERLKLLPHYVDLCHAIAYAHNRRIIHRDIKPDNVMVGEFGETVVIDWGLAKVLGHHDYHEEELRETLQGGAATGSDNLEKTMYGHALGTASYMPPEQALGQLDKIDERSDGYSLGVVLYELLTGRTPFYGSSAEDTLRRVVDEEPPSVRSIEPDVPAELAAICERAMRKDVHERYQSVRHLAKDVRNFQSGSLVQAYEYSLREYVGRFIRKHKSMVALATISVVLVSTMSVYYVRNIVAANLAANEANAALTAANTQLTEARDNEAAQRAAVERQAYQSAVVLAESHLNAGKSSAARHVLLSAPEGRRNWEWGYLYRNLDLSIQTFTGHLGVVTAAVFTPDGSKIVTSSADRSVKVWDRTTGKSIKTITGHGGGVNRVVFLNNGKQFATASDDGKAKLWDAETGEEILSLSGHSGPVTSIESSRDGSRLLTSSADGTARFWNAKSAESVMVLEVHESSVNSASFSSDGKLVVTSSSDGTAIICEAPSGKIRQILKGHTGPVRDAVFSPDGKSVVTSADDATARIWDAGSGKLRYVLEGHVDAVVGARFSADGKWVITSSNDKSAKIWDVASGRELLTLSGHDDRVTSACFDSDGRHVLTSSADGTAKLWSLDALDRPEDVFHHDAPILALDFDPEGSRLVTCSFDNTAKVWDLERHELLFVLRGHRKKVYGTAFSKNGARILTVSGDKTAKIWDAATGEELMTLKGHRDGLFKGVFSPDGSRVLTASWGEAPKLWDLGTGQVLASLEGHDGRILDIAFSPDAKRIATTGNDTKTRLWDAATGKQILSLSNHTERVNSVSFSHDSSRLVTTSHDGTAKVWDAASGIEKFTMDSHVDVVLYAEFSPDDKFIVTASADSTARYWSASTGKELRVLVGHGGGLLAVSFSPDGERIVTMSRDRTAKVWDPYSTQEPRTLAGHTKQMYGAHFAPDGRRIVTIAGDGTAHIWEAAPWNPVAWQDEAQRGRLIEFSMKESPVIDPYDYPDERADVESKINSLLQTFSKGHASFESFEGQGVYIRNPGAFEAFPELGIERGDLLFRINGSDIYEPQDVVASIESFLEDYRDDAERPHWLKFEFLNYLKRRIVALHFPGILNREFAHSQQATEGILTFALDASHEVGKGMFREGLTKSALEPEDRIVELDGHEIKDFDTWLIALEAAKDHVKSGEVTSIACKAIRDRTDQIFNITLRVR